MHHIRLDSNTDFDGWRKAARGLVLADVAPADVSWSVASDEPELFDTPELAPGSFEEAQAPFTPSPSSHDTTPSPAQTFNVPARFVDLAKTAILHRDPQRFAYLYQLLWRLRANPELMSIATDPDVARLQAMAKAVRRDEHKMHAFVRFREIGREPKSRYVAWFEPEHHIVELAAPFFARRFADMEWSILTPDVCAHWDGHAVAFTPGVAKSMAPSEDRLEETWLTYYASIFNPARLKTKAMQAEMPKKYWRNLPEAALIKPLIEDAERKTHAMVAAEASVPKKPQRQEQPMTKAKPKHGVDTLAHLREEAKGCRDCDLWKPATQTVFGEGPQHATVMLVGEQPGDKEDLAGKPFVGPAGQMLDRALAEAGVDRDKTYVTNAVKHFKFVPRGKIRLHQKPNTPEIKACRQWYERELATIKPLLVVAMGATAAQSVLGKITPINANRGHLIERDEGPQVLVTVHPSYLLRLPDADAKEREYARFVDDLKIVAAHLKAHAA
ncbi:UdgX family uracil-DNA binding protein [Rhodopseudomonas palustris]|uniref:UdgX family uracil-DNA binding protein n=1 Tax=Rhodopseudomonas palustris TaxID=1076 RepID=UPI0020CD5340|nr:UdgX family uracil-DNA binding protein [Rhodopseudomonas palustris]MCP9626000.1 UdgX family uracil-DNA binding protein [Rhodopseudomonas palustris]